MIRSFRLCAAVLLIVGMTAGACGKKKVTTSPTPQPAPAPAPAPATTPTPPPPPPPAAKPPEPRTPTEDELFASKTLDQLNAEKPLTDAFFAYDATALSDEARAALQKNSQWLKRFTSVKVVVEGHADSRGTNEYNLALGERRADAVRDYLVSLGIPLDRITLVSKGEEQPFCSEENEPCWHQNRRGHFIITAK
jgi:peptidoglycan-associated lipoprotein